MALLRPFKPDVVVIDAGDPTPQITNGVYIGPVRSRGLPPRDIVFPEARALINLSKARKAQEPKVVEFKYDTTPECYRLPERFHVHTKASKDPFIGEEPISVPELKYSTTPHSRGVGSRPLPPPGRAKLNLNDSDGLPIIVDEHAEVKANKESVDWALTVAARYQEMSSTRAFKLSQSASESGVNEIIGKILVGFKEVQKLVKPVWWKPKPKSELLVLKILSAKNDIEMEMLLLDMALRKQSKLFDQDGSPYQEAMETFSRVGKYVEEAQEKVSKALTVETEAHIERRVLQQKLVSLVAGLQVVANDKAHLEILFNRYLNLTATVSNLKFVFNSWVSGLAHALHELSDSGNIHAIRQLPTNEIVEKLIEAGRKKTEE